MTTASNIDWDAKIAALVQRALAAEQAAEQARTEVDRQLGRHLCYTSPEARERFWRDVDEAIARAALAGNQP